MITSNQVPTTTVLVVFPQQSAANWIGKCLGEAGYMVVFAKSHDVALRTLCDIQPDAAIVGGSEMEGDIEHFLAWLDGDPRVASIPTVLVAASKSQAALADIVARKRFRGGYLSWPSTRMDLLLIIEDLLNTGGQTQEPAAGRHLVLDPPTRILRGRAASTILSETECRLAHYLTSQGRRLIPVEDLLTHVFDFYPDGKNLDFARVHVASLNQKIKIVTGGRNLVRVLGKRGIVYHNGRNTPR